MTTIRFAGFGTDEPEIVLQRTGEGRFKLTRPFRYQDPDVGTIVVPRDLDAFETDLASVPWYSTWFVPVLGVHTPASILHDALISDPDAPDYRTTDGRVVGRDRADAIYRTAMAASGTPVARRWMMWSAVSLVSALRQHRSRTVPWLGLLLVVATANTAEVTGIVDWAPWLPDAGFVVRWLAAAVSLVVVMVAAGLVLLPTRYHLAAAIQSLVFGAVFLPVMLMLPLRLLVVCVLERRPLASCVFDLGP